MSNWLTYSPTSGHGNGIITITADTLSELEERTATIVASNSQYSLSASSVVTQTDKEVSGISINNITWVNNVPWYGGVATKSNCSYNVIAHFQDGTTGDVTTIATVTGSTSVPATTASTVISAGTLKLTAIYEQHTATASTTFESSGEITIYQDSYDGVTADTSTYLSFVMLEDGEIIFRKMDSRGDSRTIQYSKNGGSWISIASQDYSVINVNANDIIRFKGNNSGYTDDYDYHTNLFSTARHYIVGNIMSLVGGDYFSGLTRIDSDGAFYGFFSKTNCIIANQLFLPATTLASRCYGYMFEGCTSLTTAPSLPATTLADACYYAMFYNCTSLTTVPELPATDLAGGCYNAMFYKCTKLTTAPELPATTLANNCYWGMFSGCTSLTTAPELPATTLASHCYTAMFDGCESLTTIPSNYLPATNLAEGCYFAMFFGCTSLTTAPTLPATTLVDGCYDSMFRECIRLTTAPELPATTLAYECYDDMFKGCNRLNYIKCLATDISASYCTDTWVESVARTGTFVKSPNMSSWTTGTSGIPSGWTVIDAT